MMEVGELTSRSVSGGGEGKNDPYGAVAIFPNNCTNQTVQTPNGNSFKKYYIIEH